MGWLRALAARWRGVDRLWIDWLPVVVLLAMSQLEVVSAPGPPQASSLVLGLFAVATVLPLAWRRQAPLPVLLAVMAAVVLHAWVVGPMLSFGSFWAAILALYSVAVYRGAVQALAGPPVTALAVVAILALDPRPVGAFDWLFPLVYFSGAWGLGRVTRQRRQRAAGLADRVAQADREREQQALLAAAQERARIARELHDIVAHSVGVMVVQAEAAAEMLTRSPARAAAPLARIQSTGRQAVAELRQLLGVLRADGVGPALDPQPGIADLPTLVQQLDGAGMRVALRMEGPRRPLPAGLELSAYRIVQEALTNSRKHGGATAADVQVRYRPTALELRITDGGSGNGQAAAGGHGLVGMRERVSLYGGRLHAGPRAEGGYAVTATLPLEPPR